MKSSIIRSVIFLAKGHLISQNTELNFFRDKSGVCGRRDTSLWHHAI